MASNIRTTSSPLKSLHFKSAEHFQAKWKSRDGKWVVLGSRTHFSNDHPGFPAASSKVTILNLHFLWYYPFYGSKSHLLTDHVCIIRLCIQADESLVGLQMWNLRGVWPNRIVLNFFQLCPTAACTQLLKCQRAGKIIQILFLISVVDTVVVFWAWRAIRKLRVGFMINKIRLNTSS